jgi:hypothetical protein
MINYLINKQVYIFIFCLAFCTSNVAAAQTVLTSIVPSKRMFEISQISMTESFKKGQVEDLPLIKSLHPVFRIENKILSVQNPTVYKLKKITVKKKKTTRVYIMGSTVPIFKSVVPKIRPL